MELPHPAAWCVPLSTKRLLLRPTTPALAPEMFRVLSDPLIYGFIEDEPPKSVGEIARRYEAVESTRCSPDGMQGWFEWVVVFDGHPIGYVQATAYLERSEVGLAYVFESQSWGRGIAVESCQALMAHLEPMPGLQRFYIDADSENFASHRVAEKLGFHRQKVIVGGSRIRGAPRDDVRFTRDVRA